VSEPVQDPAAPMPAGLYVVGTPIGNLRDITLRALDVLHACDVVLAEDTRQTVKLLARHQIAKPLLSCHRFREASRVDEVVRRIREGAVLALVTDSGMPAVSDPGARMVEACRAAGLPVTVVPGPSAVTAAVALSGVEAPGFVFGGFLPHKSGARRRRLKELAGSDLPLVLFESPYRLLKLMDEIEAELGTRTVLVARELTKHFEECLKGSPADIRSAFAKRTVKGELVVVLEPLDGRSPVTDHRSSAVREIDKATPLS
jgi:16S rRNA (cytidine1402-2'-O)-methyltransferase